MNKSCILLWALSKEICIIIFLRPTSYLILHSALCPTAGPELRPRPGDCLQAGTQSTPSGQCAPTSTHQSVSSVALQINTTVWQISAYLSAQQIDCQDLNVQTFVVKSISQIIIVSFDWPFCTKDLLDFFWRTKYLYQKSNWMWEVQRLQLFCFIYLFIAKLVIQQKSAYSRMFWMWWKMWWTYCLPLTNIIKLVMFLPTQMQLPLKLL